MRKEKDKENLFESRKKEAIRLQKRANVLYKLKYSQPRIPLEKPIRDGWVRYFVVSPHVTHKKVLADLRVLLPKLNTVVHCNRKDFLHKDFRTNKLKPIEQTLQEFSERDYVDLEEGYKKYFNVYHKQYRFGGPRYRVYLFNKPDLFVFRVKTSYITHMEVHDGAIQAELNAINAKLWEVDLWAYKYGNASRGSDWYYDRLKIKDRAMNAIFKDELKAENLL